MVFTEKDRSLDTGRKVVTRSEVSGLELAEVVYDPNVIEPRHDHEYPHFCLTLGGHCVEFSQGQSQDYTRFATAYFPSGHSHAVEIQEAGYRCFSVTIQNYWLEKLDWAGRMGAMRSNNGTLSRFLLRLYREFCQPDAVSTLVIEALAAEMLVEVSRHGRSNDRKQPPRWLSQAREYLETNFGEQLSLTSIAGAVEVHPVHLAREFRRFFNCTIGEHIRNKRIEHTCHQLAESNASLAEIAHQTGFCDQSHLSKTFKRVVGVTPASFRQGLLAGADRNSLDYSAR